MGRAVTGDGSTIPKTNIQLGPCEGEVIVESPRQDKFLRWMSMFKMYVENNDVKVSVYLAGSYLQNPSSAKDVDIILTRADYDDADHEYKLRIRDTLVYGVCEALKMNMFVDMAFYIPYDTDGSFWYSSKQYRTTRKRIRSRSLRAHDRFFVEGELVQNFHYPEFAEYCKKLDKDLFEVGMLVPARKHVRKINDGEDYIDPKLLFRHS